MKLQIFTLKFIHGKWWQQKGANLQNKHFLSALGSSKNKQKIEFWKLIRCIKTKNWTLIQKSNEKENQKAGACC